MKRDGTSQNKQENPITRSHKRSKEFGLDPDEQMPRIILDDRGLARRKMKSQDLMEIARPFVEELFQLLGERSGSVILLTDSNGTILEVVGKEEDLEEAAKDKLKKGVSMDERSAGTNAIGTSLFEGIAIQVDGGEHYRKSLKNWNCAAAPIRDANNLIIGSLSITSVDEQIKPYSLGLAKATVNSVENSIHNFSVQKQLYDAQQYAFSIMNHLSFGLIAIDLKEKIHWVNDTACRSLNIRRTKLLNRAIGEVCSQWSQFIEVVRKGETVLDEEGELQAKNERSKYLLNAYAVFGQDGDKIGYVLSFRPFSRMLRLMNKYEAPQLNFSFDKIICKGKGMKKLVEYAKTVANTPSTILITGESGTGKEVFAQAIHSASERKNNAFIAINCGAISPGLIESELFGYEEGAFTGAVKGGRPGKFELAQQGTLFLDEIGEMPLDMQVKLLRVLQEKTVTRVGGSKSIKVNARLIAATNKDLEEEVKNHNFRQDLFYRLSVIPLELPPLRKRKMDIPPLYHHLLKQKAIRLDRPIPPTDPKLLQRMVHYDWPGNIRELENFAEKAVILNGDTDMLFPGINQEEGVAANEGLFLLDDRSKLPSMADIEKMVIEKYLEHFNRHITQTAGALGIGRNTLYQKMEKYGIR